MTLNRYHPKAPVNPDYEGKHDYQGNHDVFEMPEDQKPPKRVQLPPLNKIALTIILLGVIMTVVLVCASMLQQNL